MDTHLLSELEHCIEEFIEKNCEEGYWTEMIHPQLIRQMARAAAIVFDSGQDGQTYARQEGVV
jgi:hypothetical protein